MAPEQMDGEYRELAMFPLSTVLLPLEPLPLHVFEARYQTMVADLLASDREFGVVLIDRGVEVGGGDIRREVGTVATIRQVSPMPDGRYALMTEGGERFAVRSWLPEDPYPRALVEMLTTPDSTDLSLEVADALAGLREVRALWSTIGGAPALDRDVELGATYLDQVWRLCSLSPLGPLDRQQLLELDTVGDRLAHLRRLLVDLHNDYQALRDEEAP